MPKKKGSNKKRISKSRSVKKVSHKTNIGSSDSKIEQVLVENFVSLQKVMTNLSLKFENLSGQISKLLELFEISAKTMAKKDFELDGSKNDEEMVKKLDSLLEQNKVIARGITLLHEQEKPVNTPINNMHNDLNKVPVPLPMKRPIQNIPSKTIEQKYPPSNQNNYQKSGLLGKKQNSIFGANSLTDKNTEKKSQNFEDF